VWLEVMPRIERDLCLQGLGFFTYVVDDGFDRGTANASQLAALVAGDVPGLVEAGVLRPNPIVYEDFLPRSAAGSLPPTSRVAASWTQSRAVPSAERTGWRTQ
jgi:uncharacterized glyoxalase superfamily metalloenzyme YdcJ